MYLSHHYAIDLVGGGLLAAAFFYTARARWLPQPQADKLTRWNYEFVEIGDHHRISDEESYFGLGLLDHRRASSSDGWTMASSASFTSGSGTLSPTTSEETVPGVLLMDMTNNDKLWDGAKSTRDVGLSEVVVSR